MRQWNWNDLSHERKWVYVLRILCTEEMRIICYIHFTWIQGLFLYGNFSKMSKTCIHWRNVCAIYKNKYYLQIKLQSKNSVNFDEILRHRFYCYLLINKCVRQHLRIAKSTRKYLKCTKIICIKFSAKLASSELRRLPQGTKHWTAPRRWKEKWSILLQKHIVWLSKKSCCTEKKLRPIFVVCSIFQLGSRKSCKSN